MHLTAVMVIDASVSMFNTLLRGEFQFSLMYNIKETYQNTQACPRLACQTTHVLLSGTVCHRKEIVAFHFAVCDKVTVGGLATLEGPTSFTIRSRFTPVLTATSNWPRARRFNFEWIFT
jgi:hypothetical protein